MAKTYISISLAAGGGSDSKEVKVSNDDTTPKFLEDKVGVGSSKLTKQTTSPGADELLELDVDETQIDHNNTLNYAVGEHRVISDVTTTATSLWSSTKIQTELDSKINAATPMTDNKIVKSVGTSGIDVEATGITVDDSDNVTGINDLTIDGNLTVSGTTTTISSTTLDVTDANITVNNGGTQASADTADAGLTIEMSDATDVVVGYDSTLASKVKVGEIGSLSEVITGNHTQTIINKTLDIDNNTLSNVEVDNLKAGVLSTDLSLSVDDTKVAGAQAIKTYVADQLATQDDASEITYTPAVLADWDTSTDPGNVDGAADQLAARVKVNEGQAITNAERTKVGFISITQAVDLDTVESNTATNNAKVSADGLVTTHSDITSAGSGAIITSVERTKIGNISVTQAVDLDTIESDTSTNNAKVSADGVVTTHSDITSAGSGAIITVVERGLIGSGVQPSAGDISETSFSGAADVAVTLDVTGLAFANASVRSFDVQVSVLIDATADLYENFRLLGIQKAAGWDMAIESVGDDSLVSFSITVAGQIQYSKLTTAGWVSSTLKFRAETTSV